MLVPLLALSLASGLGALPSRLDRLREAVAPAPLAKSVVVLDCRVDAEALTDCQASSDSADSGRVAEAMRLAAGLAPPAAMVDNGIRRVKVRLNVAP